MNQQEKIWFKQLHEEKEKHAKVFMLPEYINVWTSVIEKYPESAHFIYELLQNADDANATSVEIKLNEDGFLFKHNGTTRFTVSSPKPEDYAKDAAIGKLGHINSITAAGLSSKKHDSADNKIGKFGVGFKAVFQYTDTPEIYDDNVCFRIVDYIVPEEIKKDHPWRKKGETLFYIPFNRSNPSPSQSYNSIEERLKKLNNPILFLHNLQEIKWSSDNEELQGMYRKEVVETITKGDVTCERLLVYNFLSEKPDDLWMFTRVVSVDKKKLPISVGYYIDDDKRVNTSRKPKVFCFFPTIESFNFCFIMHAPFALVDSRQMIKTDDQINTDLFWKLASLAADAVQYLCEIGQERNKYWISDNLFDIVPLEKQYKNDDAHNSWYNAFYLSFFKTLSEKKVHYSTDSKYVLAEKSVKIDPSLMRILTPKQYSQLTDERGYYFVYPRLSTYRNGLSEYLDSIGIEEFDIDNFGYYFSESFIRKQDDEWILKFYKFLLSDDARRLILHYSLNRGAQTEALLLYKPIIRTDRKTFVAPYTDDNKPNVFVDEGGVKVSGINYIDPFLYASKDTQRLIEKLKLGSPDNKSIVESAILPKYRGERQPDERQYIKDFLYIHSVYENSSPKDASELIKSCKENLSFKTTDGKYYNVSDIIYFDVDIFQAARNLVKDIHLLDVIFYKNIAGDAAPEVIAFLQRFGFESFLQAYRFEVEPYKRNELYSRRGDIGSYTYEIDSSLSRYNPTHFYDYRLHTFKEVVGSGKITVDYSVLVWKSIAYHLKSNKKILQGVCEFVYYKNKTAFFDSELSISLLQHKWLFNKQGQLCKPQNVTIEDLDERYERNEELYEILRLKHSQLTNDKQITKQLSKSGQETFELGMLLRENGISSSEELNELLELKREKKMQEERQRQAAELANNRLKENETAQAEPPTKQTEAKKLDERFATGSAEEGRDVLPKKSSEKKNRSAGLENFLERQQQRMDVECEKEDTLQKMAELPVYTKDWFLCGLRYEYLNSEDTGRTQTSRSVSLSFTKVLPEHSNVYHFCNASKPIPRWIEEIDGDIHVTLHFKNGEDVPINFAMACVQDFSLRLRAKSGDEQALAKINWTDLTTAELDINNPRGLVKNLYEAFRQLPFEGDFDFQKNLSSNVRFIFGPPGTGKTTYITHKMSDLMRKSKKCKILVLAPTNQACDVITRQLMEQNPDSYISWLGRFVATNDEIIDQSAVVCGRDSEIYKNDLCCVVSTIARLSYDFFENVNDGRTCLKDVKWDYVVCDEGSMISLPEIIYAIYKFSYNSNAKYIPTPIIIAGDPKQLQPIDSCNVWGKRSVYDVVELNDFVNPKTVPIQFEVTNLETQYRSVPAIGELFSRYSYGGKLKHGRKGNDTLDLNIEGLKLRPITYMPFLVDNFDDIYGAKKMAGSNVHIYSAILTAEICKYIANEYIKHNPTKGIKIGVICPYIAQVQLVEKLINSIVGFPFTDKVDITAGTIHSFQGDECNIIFALFNPPKGMASNRQDSFTMLLNDDHLVNVAISRAKDYLCIMQPSLNSVGRENLKDINRVAEILLSRSYKKEYTTGQIDCEQIEQLIFGKKGYLKSKSYITSHQMANVYTPTGYVYDIRVDESAIDIQIGSEQPQTVTSPKVNIPDHEPVEKADAPIVETEQVDIVVSDRKQDIIEETELQDTSKYDTEEDDAIESVDYEEEQPASTPTLDKEGLLSIVVQAIEEKNEAIIKQLFTSCSGRSIPLTRLVVSELVSSIIEGEDFWWFVKVVLKTNPTMFRRPIIEAIETLGNVDRFMVSDTPKALEETLELLFRDPEKISQDIDFLYPFKEYYGKTMSNEIRKACKNINHPEPLYKIFEIYPQIKGEDKIDFLMEIRNNAALYVICQMFADSNFRSQLSSEDFSVFRYAAYRKSIGDKLSNKVPSERVAIRFIRSTYENCTDAEREYIQNVFNNGFISFCRSIAKAENKSVVQNIDDVKGSEVEGKVMFESVNHYLVQMRNGPNGLLPKKLCNKPSLEQGDLISVKIIGADKRKNICFLSQKGCTVQEFFKIPLANLGDEIDIEYFNEGKTCNVRRGCLKLITPVVLNQKEHFDYKDKYHAIIVGQRSYFVYEVKIFYSDEKAIHGKYRLNKAARDCNVGIDTLVSHLRRYGHHVDMNPNTKITAEQYSLLLQAFGKRNK